MMFPSRPKFRTPAIALLLATTAVAVASGRAAADQVPPGVVSDGCTEMAILLGVPEDLVDPYVPDDRRPARSPVASPPLRPEWRDAGRAQVDLIVRAFRCERQDVSGRAARDTTTVQFGAIVQPPRSPSGGLFDVHTFYWASDNRDLVEWLREVPGAHNEMKYSDGLELLSQRSGSSGAIATPSFESRLRVTDRELGGFALAYTASQPLFETPIRVNWWVDVRDGTLRLSNSIPVFLTGPVQPGTATLAFEPRTTLAAMLRDGFSASHVFAHFRAQLTTRQLHG